jgi:hypothetical protein
VELAVELLPQLIMPTGRSRVTSSCKTFSPQRIARGEAADS